jgi:hypothetical protein
MSNTQFSADALSLLNDRLLEANENARHLQQQAELAERERSSLEELLSLIVRGWHLHIVELFGKPGLPESFRESSAAKEIFNIATEESTSILKRFPKHLEAVCSDAGLEIDRGSRHPNYKFDHGFFQVAVDDRSGIAKLTDLEAPLDTFPADPLAIVAAVTREHARVFDREFDGPRFLKLLRNNYIEITKRSGKKDGDPVPVRHITTRLGKNLKGFRTDEFLIDLSRLVEQGPPETDGFRFDLQQTKNTNQGMLLHGASGGGYVGFVTFKEVKK